MTYDPKILSAKAKMILEQYDDLLKYIIETESDIISKTKIDASTEYELTKKYFTGEGVKEGFRIIMQKLNNLASKAND
jgi:hypothetical protein